MEKIADIREPDWAHMLTPDQQRTLREARAILARMIAGRPVIQSWGALLDYLKVTLGPQRVECFRVLYLDKRNALIADEEVARGSVDHVPVYPRQIVARALALDASAVIITHNHPSGSVSPSEADIHMTRRIADALKTIDVTLHDHVLVAADKTTSFRSIGVF
jgi:DNA repair protein RadC